MFFVFQYFFCGRECRVGVDTYRNLFPAALNDTILDCVRACLETGQVSRVRSEYSSFSNEE